MDEAITPPPIPLQRPRMVWVIVLFYVISGGSGLIMQLEMLLGLGKLPPVQQELLGSLSTGAMLFSLAVGALKIVAATALWLLRKVALPLFSLGILFSIGSTAWHLQAGGIVSKMSAQSGAMVLGAFLTIGFGIFISLGIWSYTFVLWRRGVLK